MCFYLRDHEGNEADFLQKEYLKLFKEKTFRPQGVKQVKLGFPSEELLNNDCSIIGLVWLLAKQRWFRCNISPSVLLTALYHVPFL